jgi:hypothetical protein
MVFSINNLCRPATIYFWLALIGILWSLVKFKFVSAIFSLFFVLLWTALLDYLCGKGYSTISWVLLLLPLIFAIIAEFQLLQTKPQKKQTSSEQK